MKGAGDLATGVALSFHAAGFRVLMTEQENPTAIRLTVSFAAAVYDGSQIVEGVRAWRTSVAAWPGVVAAGEVAVLVDPGAQILSRARPLVVVDGIMAKANLGTTRREEAVVIALGPGFVAGKDADAVIETARGHEMGRILREGEASANTGVPGEIGGRTVDRVLRAPADGRVEHVKKIGELVAEGEIVMRVGETAVRAQCAGCLRGAVRDGILVPKGMKIGDVDPRGETGYARSVSDKARAVGRAALEAALAIGHERGLFSVMPCPKDRGRLT